MKTSLLACALVLTAVLAGIAMDAHARVTRRRAEQGAIDTVARVLPGADLALAGASRHLRFPSLEEPGAAFADGPATPDVDPAGGAIAPPIEVYVEVEAKKPRAPSRPTVGQR